MKNGPTTRARDRWKPADRVLLRVLRADRRPLRLVAAARRGADVTETASYWSPPPPPQRRRRIVHNDNRSKPSLCVLYTLAHTRMHTQKHHITCTHAHTRTTTTHTRTRQTRTHGDPLTHAHARTHSPLASAHPSVAQKAQILGTGFSVVLPAALLCYNTYRVPNTFLCP